MTGRIKLFRNVRKFYRITGIYSPSKLHQQHLSDVKSAFGLVSVGVFLISIILYFIFEANTTNEYGKSFSTFVSLLEGSVYFIVNLLKVKIILNLIKKFEDFIEMSKFLFEKN